MTREIKFRVWSPSESIMRHYYLGQLICDPFLESYFVYLDFMQYTGLKDKNGVEIYEGDVVQCTTPYVESFDPVVLKPHTKYEVIYSSEAAFMLRTLDGEWIDGLLAGRRLEIIGNIYQNPELLEK